MIKYRARIEEYSQRTETFFFQNMILSKKNRAKTN